MHLRRDWSIEVILFLLLSSVGAVYAFFVFNQYSGISIESEAVVVDELHYNRLDAQTAITSFEARTTTYEELLLQLDNFTSPVEVEISDEVDEAVETEENAEANAETNTDEIGLVE